MVPDNCIGPRLEATHQGAERLTGHLLGGTDHHPQSTETGSNVEEVGSCTVHWDPAGVPHNSAEGQLDCTLHPEEPEAGMGQLLIGIAGWLPLLLVPAEPVEGERLESKEPQVEPCSVELLSSVVLGRWCWTDVMVVRRP